MAEHGPFFHGTKADLQVGDLLTAGFRSNYRQSDPLRVVDETEDWTRLTPEALAAWRERLAALRADERGTIIN